MGHVHSQKSNNLKAKHQGLDLQNILRQSYDYLTIIPKLRSTYISFTKHPTNDARLFSGTIHLQNRKIVGDSVRTLDYDILREIEVRCKSLS